MPRARLIGPDDPSYLFPSCTLAVVLLQYPAQNRLMKLNVPGGAIRLLVVVVFNHNDMAKPRTGF